MAIVNVQVFHNPVFREEENDEGYSEEGGPRVANIVAEHSIVEIGNKIQFNGGVVILPDGNKQIPAATAEQVFNGLQTGEVKAKNIHEEFNEKRTSSICTKMGIFLGFIGTIGTIIIVLVFSSRKAKCGDFVSRADWTADPRTCKIPNYEKLPSLVLVYQTEKKICLTCAECVEQVRGLQKFQQKPRSLRATVRPAPACDIQYNFLVGGDGRIYEGRGYQLQGGMPDSFEKQTFILAFMGMFIVAHPQDEQLLAAERFLESAAAAGYLDPDFKIAGAMQVRRSDSPGCALLSDLKLWKRWTDDPLHLLNTTRTRNETYAELCTQPPPSL